MPAGSAAELYVHAIAVEREAARRYGELAAAAAAQGSGEAAALFRLLARLDAEHLAALKQRAAALALPPLEADHSWPIEPGCDSMAPQAAAAAALAAEKQARAFFEQVYRTAMDDALRALAHEMAAEEDAHIALLARL